MQEPLEILKRYWGYDAFRPLQEDIVRHAASGKDTLALLPTGGGKSICFQVPALMRSGLCLVVSPLIALMKDQVENLNKRGLAAAALSSHQSRAASEKWMALAAEGKLDFLYVSPERIQNIAFQQWIERLPLSLIAVDEAHCISQWGYDFRPSYLHIADLRKWAPNTPVLALTATATPEVVVDIQDKLCFTQGKVFSKSFERPNLTYAVVKTDNKLERLEVFLARQPGSAVVYLRNRKKTEWLADWLNHRGISAAHYHGGLDPHTRSSRQESWIKGDIRVMAATNAFGMGIDKPDVRAVAHLDLPDSLEAYFQEAGRGGRDEAPAFALAIVNEEDRQKLLQQLETQFPPITGIRKLVAEAMRAHHMLPGNPPGKWIELMPRTLAYKTGLSMQEVGAAMGLLEQAGLWKRLELNEGAWYLKLKGLPHQLRKMQVSKESLDFAEKLMRRKEGILHQRLPLKPEKLEKWCSGYQNKDPQWHLQELVQAGALEWLIPNPQSIWLQWLQEAPVPQHVRLDSAIFSDRKATLKKKVDAVLKYAFQNSQCRSRELIGYFGQIPPAPCGRCDVCLRSGSNIPKVDLLASLLAEKSIWRMEDLLHRYPELGDQRRHLLEEWLESGYAQPIGGGALAFKSKHNNKK